MELVPGAPASVVRACIAACLLLRALGRDVLSSARGAHHFSPAAPDADNDRASGNVLPAPAEKSRGSSRRPRLTGRRDCLFPPGQISQPSGGNGADVARTRKGQADSLIVTPPVCDGSRPGAIVRRTVFCADRGAFSSRVPLRWAYTCADRPFTQLSCAQRMTLPGQFCTIILRSAK